MSLTLDLFKTFEHVPRNWAHAFSREVVRIPSHFSTGVWQAVKEIIPVSVAMMLLANYLFKVNVCESFESYKSNAFRHPAFESSVEAPIIEEIIFRGLLQRLVGKYMIKWLKAEKILPHSLSMRVSSYARIILSSIVFALLHYNCVDLVPKSYRITNTFNAFLASLTFATLAESEAGLMGSIGAHSSSNFFAHVTMELFC